MTHDGAPDLDWFGGAVACGSSQRARVAGRADAGGMPSGYLPVVVYQLDESGGRRVRVDREILGLARSLRDVTEFLRRAGMDDVSEGKVAVSKMIDWRGGGPAPWCASGRAPISVATQPWRRIFRRRMRGGAWMSRVGVAVGR